MKALAVALTAATLSGCAAIDRVYDEARWKWDGFETATYTWHRADDPARCGIHYNMGNRAWGCAVRVRDSTPQAGAKPVPGSNATSGHTFIYSNVSEEDAKRIISRHGDDLWSHELRHARGWRHPIR